MVSETWQEQILGGESESGDVLWHGELLYEALVEGGGVAPWGGSTITGFIVVKIGMFRYVRYLYG